MWLVLLVSLFFNIVLFGSLLLSSSASLPTPSLASSGNKVDTEKNEELKPDERFSLKIENKWKGKENWPKVCVLAEIGEKDRHGSAFSSSFSAFLLSLSTCRYPNLDVYFVSLHQEGDEQLKTFSGHLSSLIDFWDKTFEKKFIRHLPFSLPSGTLSKGDVNEREKKEEELHRLTYDLAIDKYLTSDMMLCEYFILTRTRDLYSLNFFDAIAEHLTGGTDVIGTEYVSKDDWTVKTNFLGRAGRDVHVFSDFKLGQIVLGAMILKRKVFEAPVQLRFHRVQYEPAADGKGKKVVHIEPAGDGKEVEKKWMTSLFTANLNRKIVKRCLFFQQ